MDNSNTNFPNNGGMPTDPTQTPAGDAPVTPPVADETPVTGDVPVTPPAAEETPVTTEETPAMPATEPEQGNGGMGGTPTGAM